MKSYEAITNKRAVNNHNTHQIIAKHKLNEPTFSAAHYHYWSHIEDEVWPRRRRVPRFKSGGPNDNGLSVSIVLVQEAHTINLNLKQVCVSVLAGEYLSCTSESDTSRNHYLFYDKTRNERVTSWWWVSGCLEKCEECIWPTVSRGFYLNGKRKRCVHLVIYCVALILLDDCVIMSNHFIWWL